MFRTRFLPVAALAVLVTALSLQHSLTLGRLSFLPTYDDTVYMRSSLELLDKLNSGTFANYLGSIWLGGHHSGLFSALGSLGYMLIGRYDVSPYISLALPLFLVLYLTVRQMGKIEDWASWLFLIVLAMLPLFQLSVAEFRPDFFWGLFLTYGGFRFVFTWLKVENDSPKPSILLPSAVFALGSVLKPMALIASISLLIGFALVPLILAVLLRVVDTTPRLIQAAQYAGKFIGLTILLQIVFLIPYSQMIRDYTVLNLFQVAHLWGEDLPLFDKLLYYPRVSLKVFAISGLSLLAGIWILATLVAAKKRSIEASTALIAAAGLIMVAYVPSTVVRNKSIFLGAPFLGAIFWSIVFLYPVARRIGTVFVPGVLAALLLVVVYRPFDVSAIMSRKSADLIALDRDKRAVLDATIKLAQASADSNFLPRPGGTKLFVNTAGTFDHGLWAYETQRQRIPSSSAGDLISSDFPPALEQALSSHIVVLPRLDAPGLLTNFPSTATIEPLADALQKDGMFEPVSGVPESMRVYVRKDLLVRAQAGRGWRASEGPYPAQGLPVVRWMTEPNAEIKISSSRDFVGTLYLDCRAGGADQKVTLSIDDGSDITATYKSIFSEVEIPAHLTANRLHRLSIKTEAKPGLIILCRSFRLGKVDQR